MMAQMAVVGIGIGLTFLPVSTAFILRLIGMTISVSSLTTYGLYRVNQLAILAQGQPDFDTSTFINVYADATVKVLGEMGLIGAVICGLALLPALTS